MLHYALKCLNCHYNQAGKLTSSTKSSSKSIFLDNDSLIGNSDYSDNMTNNLSDSDFEVLQKPIKKNKPAKKLRKIQNFSNLDSELSSSQVSLNSNSSEVSNLAINRGDDHHNHTHANDTLNAKINSNQPGSFEVQTTHFENKLTNLVSNIEKLARKSVRARNSKKSASDQKNAMKTTELEHEKEKIYDDIKKSATKIIITLIPDIKSESLISVFLAVADKSKRSHRKKTQKVQLDPNFPIKFKGYFPYMMIVRALIDELTDSNRRKVEDISIYSKYFSEIFKFLREKAVNLPEKAVDNYDTCENSYPSKRYVLPRTNFLNLTKNLFAIKSVHIITEMFKHLVGDLSNDVVCEFAIDVFYSLIHWMRWKIKKNYFLKNYFCIYIYKLHGARKNHIHKLLILNLNIPSPISIIPLKLPSQTLQNTTQPDKLIKI